MTTSIVFHYGPSEFAFEGPAANVAKQRAAARGGFHLLLLNDTEQFLTLPATTPDSWR